MIETKSLGRIMIIILIVCAILSCYMIVVMSINAKNKDKSSLADLKNFWVNKAAAYPKDTIAVLNIFTPIIYNDDTDYFGIRRSGAIYWVNMLKSVESNPNIHAVILRINSPGGTVAATQEVYNEIKRLREKGKLVTVSMGDLAASGAYYISSSADYIVANPGTLTGSIGVIIEGLDLSDLFKKIGITYNVIKSGKNKDILSSYRKMTPEEYNLLKDVIMDTYDQFFNAVSEGRKIKPDELKTIADGRIFSGRQALKVKLIDELGDFEDTVKITAKMAGIIGEPNVIELKPDVENIFKYLTSNFEGFLSAKNNLKLINSPFDSLKDNNSPVLYFYNY